MDTTRELRRYAFTGPFRGLWALFREMNRIADSTTCYELARTGSGPETWRPSADVFVRENDLLIRCDLTGMSSDDIEVTCTEDTLVITGTCEQGAEDGVARHGSERCRGTFRREFPLESQFFVSEADVEAEFDDGLLEITVRSTSIPSTGVNIPVSTATRVPVPRPSVEGVSSEEVPQEV